MIADIAIIATTPAIAVIATIADIVTIAAIATIAPVAINSATKLPRTYVSLTLASTLISCQER
jgi:hypothetical protein